MRYGKVLSIQIFYYFCGVSRSTILIYCLSPLGCIGKFGRRQGEKLSLKICKAGQVTARLFLCYSNAIFFRAGAPDALDGSLFSDFSFVLSKDKSQTRRKKLCFAVHGKLPSVSRRHTRNVPIGVHFQST